LLIFYAAEIFTTQEGKYPYIEVVPKEECEGVQHMEKFFQDVVNKGGEGIILRDPNAAYQSGRSPGYLKHKVFFPIHLLFSNISLKIAQIKEI